MPSRSMNDEPPRRVGAGKTLSLQEGEMPIRAMDEPEPNIPQRALSPREQEKLAAHRRDQTARTKTKKDEMPTGT